MKAPRSISLYSCLILLFGIPAISHAAPKDACSLISSADAEAALGEPVGAPRSESRPSPQGEGTVCKFRSTQGTALRAKSLSVTVRYSTTDLKSNDGAMADELKSAGFKTQSVAGVGDNAIWAVNGLGKPMDELTVRKGKSILLIIILSGIPDQSIALDRAKALAAKILPKT